MVAGSFQADTVFKGANIITVDPNTPHAQALAMKDGKFVGVGSDSDIEGLIGPGTNIQDMRGKTIVPGFIDAHIHVLSSGTRHVMAADCDQRSIAEIQSALRERVDSASRGQWIQGFKFDDTKTQENRFLDKDDLDAVSDELPIMVSHRAGHVYYLNSVALELSGYHNESEDPAGGRLGREPDTGELNGVLYERAAEPAQEMVPEVTAEVRRRGLKTICGMLTAAGLTSVHDARVSNLELNTYQEGRDNGDLSLRVYMLMGHPHFPALRDAGVKTGFGDDRLRIGGIKMVSDGAIAARTAYLSEPYVDSDDHGILTMTAEETETAVMEMHQAGFQVAIHANGDLAIDMVLNAYEKAQLTAEIIWKRLKNSGVTFGDTSTEYLGLSSCHGEINALPSQINEVVLRLGVKDSDKNKVNRFGKELAPVITSGPPGITGFSGGRPKAQEIIAYWPALIPKELVHTTVDVI